MVDLIKLKPLDAVLNEARCWSSNFDFYHCVEQSIDANHLQMVVLE